MTTSYDFPTLESLKAQAKRLRATLAEQGSNLSHSQTLELLAQQHGCRDWNTLSAKASKALPLGGLRLGDQVTGRYLSQPFTAKVLGLSAHGDEGHFHIRLHFDEAVDVVTFDSFSSFRQRVRGVVDAKGRSPRKTSDGQPQLVLDL